MLARRMLILAGIVSLAGCGGGGADLEAPPQPVTPRVRIHWPALGRAMEATPYAYSVRVTFNSAGNDPMQWGQDSQILANRVGPNETTTEYAASQAIRPGYVQVDTMLFSGPNGTGRVLKSKSELLTPDPSGAIPDIVLPDSDSDNIVKSLALRCPDRVAVGESATMAFDMFGRKSNQRIDVDSPLELKIENAPADPENGPVVTVERVNPFWSVDPVSHSSEFITNGFRIRALRPGKTTISGRIDGVDSNQVTIVVPAP